MTPGNEVCDQIVDPEIFREKMFRDTAASSRSRQIQTYFFT
ncbi:MAG: hypothetical protein U1E96_02980 [Azonexus sp.]